MLQATNHHKRKAPTFLSSFCGRLQLVVDEALESPTKLSRLNSESRTLVAQECARPIPWLGNDESGEALAAEVEDWWLNGVGANLKQPLEVSQSALVVSLTAFRSLLEYLDRCLTKSGRLLPSALPKLLIQTSASQLMQFAKSSILQEAPESTCQVLTALIYLCLARINGLCSTQPIDGHASQEGRKCSTAALSEFLIQELHSLYIRNEYTLCLVIMASFAQSLHRAIIYDAAWRAGFKPALQQLATLSLRISLDGSCEAKHPKLANEARRTLALLTWKAIKGSLQIKGFPDDPNLSAFEWAMESSVMSLQAHVTSLHQYASCIQAKSRSGGVTTPEIEVDVTSAAEGILSSQMDDASPTHQMSASQITDFDGITKEQSLDRVTTLLKGISASFRTVQTLLEYGGNCSPSSIGEEAFGNMRYHALECGVSILKVDTTVLWPTLVQCAQLIVQMSQQRHSLQLKLADLRAFLSEYCQLLGSLIESFPSAKAAMFSKFLRKIFSILFVDFDSLNSCIQVLCLSCGSIANLLKIISRKVPSFFVSTMLAVDTEAENQSKQWQQESRAKVYVFEQLCHSAFSILRKIRTDLVAGRAEDSAIRVIAGMHNEERDTLEASSSKEQTNLRQNISKEFDYPLTNPTINESICSCIIELLQIIAQSRLHGSHFQNTMKPSLVEEELEVIWFLFRGLESIQNIKGSALAYKTIGTLFTSKQRPIEAGNSHLGNTLAWLNLIYQLLLANEAQGFHALLSLVKIIMIPIPPVATQRMMKSNSPFLSAVIALLCLWEKEFVHGHLRTAVSATTVDSLHLLLEELRQLEPRSTSLSELVHLSQSKEQIDKFAVLRRLVTPPADSLAGLIEQLGDAWAGVLPRTLVSEATSNKTAQYEAGSAEIPRSAGTEYTNSASFATGPAIQTSHYYPSSNVQDYSTNPFSSSQQSQDDYDHLFEGADNDDDSDDVDSDEEDLGMEENDEELEEEDDSDVTMTSPEESPSEPRTSAENQNNAAYDLHQSRAQNYQRGEKTVLSLRSDDSSDLQELHSDTSAPNTVPNQREPSEVPHVPYELMTVDDDDDDVVSEKVGEDHSTEPVTQLDEAMDESETVEAQQPTSLSASEDVPMTPSSERPSSPMRSAITQNSEKESHSIVDVSMTASPATTPLSSDTNNEPHQEVIAPLTEKVAEEQHHVEVSGNLSGTMTSDPVPMPAESAPEPVISEINQSVDNPAASSTDVSQESAAPEVAIQVKESETNASIEGNAEHGSHHENEGNDVEIVDTTKGVVWPPVVLAAADAHDIETKDVMDQAPPSDVAAASQAVTDEGCETAEPAPSGMAIAPLTVTLSPSRGDDDKEASLEEEEVTALEYVESQDTMETGVCSGAYGGGSANSGTYSPIRVIADDDGAVLLTDDDLGDEDEESVTVTDPVVVNIGTPEVGPLDDLRVPSHLIDSPKSFDSGISSPADATLLEDKSEEYQTSLARSHEISDIDS